MQQMVLLCLRVPLCTPFLCGYSYHGDIESTKMHRVVLYDPINENSLPGPGGYIQTVLLEIRL